MNPDIDKATPRPCRYCGDPSHEATAPTTTCIEYLRWRKGDEYAALNAIAEAAQGLMDSIAWSNKQWIGLNMLNAGQHRAYEILQAGQIKAEKALATLAQLRAKEKA